MNKDHIKAIFEGIDDATKEFLLKDLTSEFSFAITEINKSGSIEQLTPSPGLILQAFRLCPVNSIKVVLIGQDPYIRPGQATGLSFSVPRDTALPPSLANIYKCLAHGGFIESIPRHGDLSNWARQGVLLLNASLTTILGKSRAHATYWAPYVSKLIAAISQRDPKIIFILLGNEAKGHRALINDNSILEWGHPSPLNSANQTENKANFKYCDAFIKVNDILIKRGENQINWDPDAAPLMAPPMTPIKSSFASQFFVSGETADIFPVTESTLWIFTDGGCKGNGKSHCISSWAYYVTDSFNFAKNSGLVAPKEISGEKYKNSNNRGELTAILNAFDYICANISEYAFENVIVVSDSQYSINCITEWADGWLSDPKKCEGKKNLDIIFPIKKLIDENFSKKKILVQFKHVRSHMPSPADTNSEEWFIWKCNDIVDKECGARLL